MATQDVFGRRPLEFGGAFAADSACINLSLSCTDDNGDPLSSAGLLTQQLGIQYQQPITRLYEVGTQLTYYVAGRPQGSANIARILGPGTVMAALYACLGDVCQADKNDLCFCVEANCIGNQAQDFNGMSICLKNVVLQSLGFSVQAQDMIINEQMSLFFTAMLAQDQQFGCQCDPVVDVTCACLGTTPHALKDSDETDVSGAHQTGGGLSSSVGAVSVDAGQKSCVVSKK